MIKKILTTGAVTAAALLMVVGGSSTAMAAGQNLVQNGNFDQTRFWKDNGNWYEGEKLGAWDINAYSGDEDAPTVRVWNRTQDERILEKAAPFEHGAWARVMGSISQTIPTEAGKTYTMNYLSRATGSGPGGSGWNGGNKSYATVDGVTIDTFNAVLDPLYTQRSVNFVATSDSTLISFGNAGGGAVGFDVIQVFEVPENDSPLMAPAIAGGIGIAALAGGSALAVSRKNKRSSK